MAMRLLELPTDVILEIIKFLELPGPLNLTLTCSRLYMLSNEPIFWISVLEATRNRYPLACSIYADLSEYNLDALKRLAVSWIKLHRNWNQIRPRIVQPAITTHLHGPAHIIFNVQGTDILVFAQMGSVFCWDAKRAAPFPLPAIETGGHVTRVSGPLEAPGVCSFAVMVTQINAPNTARRYFITMEHKDGKALSFTGQFSTVSLHQGRHFESLWVTAELVGTVIAMAEERNCILTTGGLYDNNLPEFTSTAELHRSLHDDDLVVSFTHNGHLYMLMENRASVAIYHISRQSLLGGQCKLPAPTFCPKSPSTDFPSSAGQVAFCFMIPSTPIYGISAVFVRLHWKPSSGLPATSFTFLPSTLTDATSDDGLSSPLAFDSPCVTEYVDGQMADMSLLWLDHSGFNVAAVIQIESEEQTNGPVSQLVLVRFHPETSATSTHCLDLPEFINIDNLESLCVDDTAGAIHLTVQLRTHSLYAPYIDQDLQNRWWDFGADAYVNTNKHIRLTRQRPSQMGWLWSRLPMTATNFVIEVEFKIATNDGSYLYGDGMAIWLTRDRAQPGPVFGSKDNFEGLAIFLDTYSNSRHGYAFPRVAGMLGDGKTSYNVGNDGDGQTFGACTANFRQTNVATKVKITYVKDDFLDVKVQYRAWDEWTDCFRQEKFNLLSAPFLGFSAMTGDVSDNHDIISVTSYAAVLSPATAQRDKAAPTFFSRGPSNQGTWLGFFFKLFLFAGVCVGGYYGWEEYKRRNMYGAGNFGMRGGGYGGGFGSDMYDKRF
ncbi:mannose ER-golgi intermediate compartment [Favolaschia claudopus]|uniref:Mannose ER-golgi intermediate compartment n=1 Tax=Favolaschia claudopus TaxID=2862362 RepID=A0AAW0DYE4_9AGAR